jgi:hypothetical protein
MNRSYTSSPPWRLHGVAGQLYFIALLQVTVFETCFNYWGIISTDFILTNDFKEINIFLTTTVNVLLCIIFYEIILMQLF